MIELECQPDDSECRETIASLLHMDENELLDLTIERFTLAEADNLFHALVQRAFRGEL